MTYPMTPACTLCNAELHSHFYQDKQRRYFQCRNCALIFADPATWLLPDAEKRIYEQHQNSPEDQGYRQFLERLAHPLAERLGKQPLEGLDFGSGPGPTLHIMLEAMGHSIAIYDPYFAPDAYVLEKHYDFVTCTEAMEHFYTPAKEWQLMLGLIKPGGWLGIMTQLSTGTETFPQWHYKNDPTHVSFFSRATFLYLAETCQLGIEFFGNNVIIMRKGFD